MGRSPAHYPHSGSPSSPLPISLISNRHMLTPSPSVVLGALSKSLATIVTQPLIVAKVGLQSRPPPERNGKPFKTFGEVMSYIIRHEGLVGLLKGIGPQLTKGLLVQGLLMMTKERYARTFLCCLFSVYRRTVPGVRSLGERYLRREKEGGH